MEAILSAATVLAALLSTLPVAGTITDNIIIWVPLVFFGIIIYFLWRMMRLMPRVKPQVMQPDSDSAVTWDDVAGVPEAQSELEEVVEFLQEPDRFAELGARVPKGILLYGPPGTGKTLLAKAVARESGAAFYGQSASAFVEMFAGLGASRIRKLFETARKNQPAIVFIDELDAVGMKRSGNSFNREHDQTLNQLLVELDGFQGAPQVVVIGASNRLEDLDPALLRPGRFDRQVLVMPPDLAGRISILNVHTRGKPLGADVDLEQIARQTSGLTGADLANLCNEAAISAGRATRGSLIASDFDLALERVVAGLQQRRVVSEKEKRILAFHEAGHALMSHLVGDPQPVQKVTIVSRGRALGYTLNTPQEDRYLQTKEELFDLLKVLLAGRAAEQVVFGRITNGAANDLERATELARSMVFEYGMGDAVNSRTVRADNYALSEHTKELRDAEQSGLTDRAYHDAVRLLGDHRTALDVLASGLLDKETLLRPELEELLADVVPDSDSSAMVGKVVPLVSEG
jgi:cell division protease FtsH